MSYLPRTLEKVIEEASSRFKVVMVSGMRPALSDAKWILKLESLGIPIGMASVISMAAEPYAISPGIIVHSIWNM
ncbi:MAG: hypothetical protein NC211_01455 [Alistipes senegalensis]|nr:hypothetical protein [Oxalobacter formigenes]MCM1280491.1 hypothetical protein [Alistipes senegalensis]